MVHKWEGFVVQKQSCTLWTIYFVPRRNWTGLGRNMPLDFFFPLWHDEPISSQCQGWLRWDSFRLFWFPAGSHTLVCLLIVFGDTPFRKAFVVLGPFLCCLFSSMLEKYKQHCVWHRQDSCDRRTISEANACIPCLAGVDAIGTKPTMVIRRL